MFDFIDDTWAETIDSGQSAASTRGRHGRQGRAETHANAVERNTRAGAHRHTPHNISYYRTRYTAPLANWNGAVHTYMSFCVLGSSHQWSRSVRHSSAREGR